MVWNGLVIAAIPSLVEAYGRVPLVAWLVFAAGLVIASAAMYDTLVNQTGAVPAEHFSVEKRPAYRTYQQTTNRFFPGPRRAPEG
jgi:steroid 5-alpha reductase family enzyme